MLAPTLRGLSDHDPAETAEAVLACWDAFLDVATAPSTDLLRPSRLPGWSGKDTCVHLGAWEGSTPLQGLLESARTGGGGQAGDPDASNAALVAAHRGDSVDEVVASLVRARDALEDFFGSDDVALLGRELARSAVGPLPVLGLVHAGCYELAVHALDLAPCGAPVPDALLLDRGLGALIDVTGSLCARRGLVTSITAATPSYGWRATSGADGWTTERVVDADSVGPGARGSAQDLLDASAGRVGLPQLLLSTRLTVQDLPGFMRLAPLLEEVPGLPGGAVLKRAVGGLGRVTRLLGRR